MSFHFFRGSNSSREKLAALPKVIPAENGSLGAPPAAKVLIPKGSLEAVLRPGLRMGATVEGGGVENGLVEGLSCFP